MPAIPLDGAGMKKSLCQGMHIDKCPKCGGVWLDHGELEILVKAAQAKSGGELATGFVVGMIVG